MKLLPPATTHWFTKRQSRWGWVRLSCSTLGITSVSFADEKAALHSPHPTTADQQIETSDWSQAPHDLELAFSEIQFPSLHSQVAIDISGSPFQQRVWTALRHIPWGQTWSYAELATAIGQPQALRAVGTACGANPLAMLIPCHRVRRSNGTLGGYRWGLARKQALLDYENKHIPLR